MTLASWVFAFSPAALGAAALWRLGARDPGGFLFVLSLVPPLSFRLLQFLRPVELGVSYLHERRFSSWWASSSSASSSARFPSTDPHRRCRTMSLLALPHS